MHDTAKFDRRRLRARFGIRTHLALGLTAVVAVIVTGHMLAARTTRAAVEAVSAMRTRDEPLARRASRILEKLTDFDQALSGSLQSGVADSGAVTAAGGALTSAVNRYFDGTPRPLADASAERVRAALAAHIAEAQGLLADSAERARWRAERWRALDRVHFLISTAGGAGLAINGGQVIARASLSQLEGAIDAVRDGDGSPGVIAARERRLLEVLRAHGAELDRSPGAAWVQVVRSDFDRAIRLRRMLARLDARDGIEREALLAQSNGLTTAVQDELLAPTRHALLAASHHAAVAAEAAEHTVTLTGTAVLGVMLLVSVLLAVSISLPVRRLTAATRLLASGDREARAPRGGSAEIDELAESFNTMADRISQAESDLRAHQAELESHVAERTRQLHHLAHHDPLTQLPNRRQLAARLGGALERAQSTGRRLALLFIDIDNFKSVNDTLGHNFGDRVLQGVAERLHRAAGAGSLIARLGGDEFTVLIEDVRTVDEVERRAAALITALQQPLTVDGRQLSTSASIGGSLFPDHAADPEGLLRAADVALFRAKEMGRNRFALYRSALYDETAQRFRLEQALRQAVEAGDLLLMFQPEVSLSGGVCALEALMRWRKADGRIAPAAEFIHVAEKSGLVHELSGWVLRSAAQAVSQWRAAGWQEARVAINVSPTQLLESDFVDRIARTLSDAGLPPGALELELTETVLQTGTATIDSLRRLKDLGVSIALDDFGIGYSSLTSLEQLPIHRVKLDRVLIERVDANPRSAAIVRSIVTLCHGLGLQVVAEGVERPAQLEFLSHCAPIAVQGYLLGRPVEAAVAQREAQAAGVRARTLLEAVPAAPLVLVGGPAARKRSL